MKKSLQIWMISVVMILAGNGFVFAQTNTFPSSGNVGIGNKYR